MMLKLAFIALSLVLSITLEATIFHQIDPTKPLQCTFSARHHNRIAVVDGRVAKLICPDGPFSYRMEETSGQIFLQTLQTFQETITISVITERGLVQDIELLFDDRSAETLILSEGEGSRELRPGCQGPFPLIDAIKCGRAPNGFVRRKSKEQCWELSANLRAQQVSCYEGPYEHLLLLKITNSAPESCWLIEPKLAKQLNMPRCKWLYLDSAYLKPGASVLALVAMGKA